MKSKAEITWVVTCKPLENLVLSKKKIYFPLGEYKDNSHLPSISAVLLCSYHNHLLCW